MKILLLGATGFTGKKVLKELLSRGYSVSVITRNLNSINISDSNLEIHEGNILDEELINRIVPGHDAVINCLGIGGKGMGKQNNLISKSTNILVRAMQENSVKRLIAMSNIGAGESFSHQPWFFRKILLPTFFKWLIPIIEDKNKMEKIIFKSDLEWTVLRFPNIKDGSPKGNVYTSYNGKGLKLNITITDAAKFIVDQLRSEQLIQKSPSVSN